MAESAFELEDAVHNPLYDAMSCGRASVIRDFYGVELSSDRIRGSSPGGWDRTADGFAVRDKIGAEGGTFGLSCLGVKIKRSQTISLTLAGLHFNLK